MALSPPSACDSLIADHRDDLLHASKLRDYSKKSKMTGCKSNQIGTPFSSENIELFRINLEITA